MATVHTVRIQIAAYAQSQNLSRKSSAKDKSRAVRVKKSGRVGRVPRVEEDDLPFRLFSRLARINRRERSSILIDDGMASREVFSSHHLPYQLLLAPYLSHQQVYTTGLVLVHSLVDSHHLRSDREP